MKKVRCAIYTRKSSEEGLEQDFNSLHAQREACAAYILSQASEGWSLLPEQYDDGGLSGGSLERPALLRLLADVAAGRIDIIVVYKVDRLTRSLLDFSKLVEAFDKAGTSFVSVTQSFNTTTSMGRLTLNMLLSFAQFEREVTAERIRDKIAASKAKGMWMGGTPPLGYRPDGRTLAIVEEHAMIVRDIYRRYLALGAVRTVAEALAEDGVTAPVRTSGSGLSFGGGRFGRGQLYAILKNPIYVGDIVHRGEKYVGQQPAIIDREIWEAVQTKLAVHLRGERRARSASTSLLAGLVTDRTGEPLVAVHACKGKVRYRYYVSRSLQHAGRDSSERGIRLPARDLEQFVVEQLAELFDYPIGLATRLGIPLSPELLPSWSERCSTTAAELRQASRKLVPDLVAQVRVLDDRVEIDIRSDGVADGLNATGTANSGAVLTIAAAVRLTRTGRALRLVQQNGSVAGATPPNQTLIGLILKARRWWSVLAEGEEDVATLATREGVTGSYLVRVVRLAFLAPSVVDAILEGRQRCSIDGTVLTSTDAIQPCWSQQESGLLPH